jgi:hypothetical protein
MQRAASNRNEYRTAGGSAASPSPASGTAAKGRLRDNG